MAVVNLHISNIYLHYYNFLMVPIVIILHENISIDIFFDIIIHTYRYLEKNCFTKMTEANLHINNIYYKFLLVPIVIIHPENISI